MVGTSILASLNESVYWYGGVGEGSVVTLTSDVARGPMHLNGRSSSCILLLTRAMNPTVDDLLPLFRMDTVQLIMLPISVMPC